MTTSEYPYAARRIGEALEALAETALALGRYDDPAIVETCRALADVAYGVLTEAERLTIRTIAVTALKEAARATRAAADEMPASEMRAYLMAHHARDIPARVSEVARQVLERERKQNERKQNRE